MEAYKAALRGARRQSDYLIERARQLFPGASAEQKVKAMNYLLPHIRRMPEKLARDQFAADAAQKLGIDSAVLREELRQAALKRRDRIEVRAAALTEVERVLLRALAITDPENEPARRLAAEALAQQPAWFEHLGAFSALQALAGRQARDPMDVVEDAAQRALLAEALLAEDRAAGGERGASAMQEIQERAVESPPARSARPDCRSRAPRRLCRIGPADAAEAGAGPGAAAVAQPKATAELAFPGRAKSTGRGAAKFASMWLRFASKLIGDGAGEKQNCPARLRGSPMRA